MLNDYNKPGVWDQGDFNYDGTVGFADLGLLLNNYSGSISGTINAAEYRLDAPAVSLLEADGFRVTGVAVPEPASCAIALGTLAIAARRRRG